MIVDVRSPAEFAVDHIPGAINRPVLDDAERERIGILYQHSPFEAKKAGAVLVGRNIARHIEENWLGQPRSWRPLIYCWRGGQRSSAMTHILRQIGFAAERLEGGYKSYRHHVLEQLQSRPPKFSFRVICGLTGSGKSRLLAALKQAGAQVLDLEALARHRGSILGDVPDVPQPSQKGFDSELLLALESFDPARPVYVESESRKIGILSVPDALLLAMREGACLHLDTPLELRVALLREDYAHFQREPALLAANLDRLQGKHGDDLLTRWRDLGKAAAWDELVAELLERHYDPAYGKSIRCNFPNYDRAQRLLLNGLTQQDFSLMAEEALAMKMDFDNNDGSSTESN